MRRAVLLVAGATAWVALLAGCTAAGITGTEPGTVRDVAGIWGIQDTEGVSSLDLAEDGTASGTDGCNRIVGTWEQDGDQVAFSPWAITRMACQSVDTWLSESVKATVQGGNLVFSDEFGIEIGTLQPNS
ncbi:META domain-containing protein [Cellulomonas sp. ICMP 17802]|uniref:META domain-containing protein n=1 Tax=Cellulomonas sp. ICMP 17802 TaxID=3239199 RepID=UPI00351BC37E